MSPTKEGQIVKFHTPYPTENPNKKFVVLEIYLDIERPKALVQELNGGKPWPMVDTYLVEDLEVVEIKTDDLIEYEVTIKKEDQTFIKGIVQHVKEKEIMLELSKGLRDVDTNVWLTIQDNKGIQHSGTLFVN